MKFFSDFILLYIINIKCIVIENSEGTARVSYGNWMKTIHHDVEVTKSGFWIHPELGFLGASPDGKVECSCCGSGICEIKVKETKPLKY